MLTNNSSNNNLKSNNTKKLNNSTWCSSNSNSLLSRINTSKMIKASRSYNNSMPSNNIRYKSRKMMMKVKWKKECNRWMMMTNRRVTISKYNSNSNSSISNTVKKRMTKPKVKMKKVKKWTKRPNNAWCKSSTYNTKCKCNNNRWKWMMKVTMVRWKMNRNNENSTFLNFI